MVRRSRKSFWVRHAWLLLLLIPALIFTFRWYTLNSTWIYPSLGVSIPRGYGSVGMDLSRWNGRVNWSDVPSGSVRLDFVWIKATEGLHWKDPQYQRNREGAREMGIRSGAYHFFRPELDAAGQARHFYAYAQPAPGDLPPVLDLESDAGLPPEELARRGLIWLEELSRLCGCKPVLYTNQHYYRLLSPWLPRTQSIWLAAYGYRTAPLMQEDPRILFWQFSDQGRVNGIREAVDLNVFRGDTAALRRWVEGSW